MRKTYFAADEKSSGAMNVLHPNESFEAVDQQRPVCPECNLGMWLVGRTPRALRDGKHEHRTYVFYVCGTSNDVTV